MGTKVPIQLPFWGGVSPLLPMRSIVFFFGPWIPVRIPQPPDTRAASGGRRRAATLRRKRRPEPTAPGFLPGGFGLRAIRTRVSLAGRYEPQRQWKDEERNRESNLVRFSFTIASTVLSGLFAVPHQYIPNYQPANRIA